MVMLVCESLEVEVRTSCDYSALPDRKAERKRDLVLAFQTFAFAVFRCCESSDTVHFLQSADVQQSTVALSLKLRDGAYHCVS